MVLIGYHSIGGYKLFDLVSKHIMISRDVMIDEMKYWDWDDNFKKDSMRIPCDETSSEADKEIQSEGSRVQVDTSRP